jgi:hypothetical protein
VIMILSHLLLPLLPVACSATTLSFYGEAS